MPPRLAIYGSDWNMLGKENLPLEIMKRRNCFFSPLGWILGTFTLSSPSQTEGTLNCFFQEAPLQRFMEIVASSSDQPKWKEWTVESALQIEIITLVVKFWTGRIPDHDIELYLKRYCEALHPPIKPVDKFGLWDRKFKVRLRRDKDGHFIHIPNSISLGPYNGRVIYPGQTARCFICQASDHQVKECPTIKCWKCGNLGHKAKICQNESECSLCGQIGHTFSNVQDHMQTWLRISINLFLLLRHLIYSRQQEL